MLRRLFVFILMCLLINQCLAEIKHIVVFKYKPTVTLQQRQIIMDRFLMLKHESKKNGKSYIVSLVGGDMHSVEGLDRGFNQTFIVTFKNQSDANYYIGQPFYTPFDPAHERFKQFVKPFLALDKNGKPEVLVFDFVIK